MNWKIKASIQKVLSITRIGDMTNHLYTKTKKNHNKFVFIYQFHECIRKLNLTKLDLNSKNLRALEIGTGYTIISPILLFLLGFDRVITVDITNDISIKSFKKQFSYINSKKQFDLLVKNSIYNSKELEHKINQIKSFNNLKKILEFCQITYIPKYNIDNIDELNIKFNYIYSQVVFEHINPELLKKLFYKFNSWLKSQGYSVHTINFIDHFANPGFFKDKNISEFNFLKYSDNYWSFWANNNISYTNRLSYLFYINLCEINSFINIKFTGENYQKQIPLPPKLIHEDILKKYKDFNINIKELTEFQRGTLLFMKN